MNVDVEALLSTWLPTQVSGLRAVTELPAELADAVPLVRVFRIGGPDPTPGLDVATLDIEAFADARQSARTLAYQIQYALRFKLPGHVTDAGSVARVRTISGPAWRPYDNPNVRRFGALYEITTHSRQS